MSTERIIINEQDQTQDRVVLSDVFNVLVVIDSTITRNPALSSGSVDSTLYESREALEEAYGGDEEEKVISIIGDLIGDGLGVYIAYDDDNLTKYKDKYAYDIAFVADFRADSSNEISKINDLIEARGDLLYLVSDKTTTAEAAQRIANTCGASNPSYKAQYSPAIKLYADKENAYPASYAFLRNFAQALAKGIPAWYAMAGVNRGLVNYIESTSRVISDDEFNSCQDKDQVENSNYNPIMYLNGAYGNVIYGQRTLQKEKTALKSVNVRILCNMIKKRIFNICLGLLFDTNDLVLWNEFRGQLEPYLANMKFNRGLVSYEIIMDQKSQKAVDDMTVKGYVRVQPTRAAEYFDIDFVLTKANTETEG